MLKAPKLGAESFSWRKHISSEGSEQSVCRMDRTGAKALPGRVEVAEKIRDEILDGRQTESGKVQPHLKAGGVTFGMIPTCAL